MWGDSKTRRRRSSSSKKNKKKQQDQAASISSVTDVDLSLAVQGKKNIHLLQVGIDGVAAGISKYSGSGIKKFRFVYVPKLGFWVPDQCDRNGENPEISVWFKTKLNRSVIPI